jgi:hypothetical protein
LHWFSRDRPPPLPVASGAGEEVLLLELECHDDIVKRAPGKALQQDSAIVALRDREARLPVVVGRAQGLVVSVVCLDALETF